MRCSPTFGLGELFCLFEEFRRRHLLASSTVTSSAAIAEQVHPELVHVGKVMLCY